VSIAPKLRGQPAGTASAASKNQESHAEALSASTSTGMKKANALPKTRPLALRHLPMRLIDVSSLPPPQDPSNDSCILFVSPTSFSRIFDGARPTMGLALYASICVLPAPTIKNIPITGGAGSTAAGANTPSSSDSSVPATKQLLLDGKNKQRSKESEEKNEGAKVERVAFRVLYGVPERHVIIFGRLPRSNIGDWDLVS
jgi:hypothetical protein